MSDAKKTKKQLTNELVELRKRVNGLENENAERRKKEHALQLTQFAVDRAADAIFWMGPDARFFYVNDEACRSLGYSREELLSMTVHDIDPNFPEEVWPAHWEQIKQRGSFTIESSHSAKDGRVFPVEIILNYLKFNSNEYSCAFARNITERKKAEENWQNIFQAIGHPTIILDKDHYVLAANRATVTVTGKALQDIIGKKCHEVFHVTHEPPEGCPFEKMLCSGNFETEPMEMKAFGGTYLVSCTPVLDSAGCELNILLGLCVGDDTLFIKHSEAPVTVLAVKDRVLAHNPLGALYTSKNIYTRLNTRKPRKKEAVS